MSHIAILYDIPGTSLRSGQIIDQDEEGYFVVRGLTREEIAAILTHPECLSGPLRGLVERPPRDERPPRRSPHLRVL